MAMDYQKTFSDIMDELIERYEIENDRRLTAKEIADTIGMSPSSFSKLFNEKDKPRQLKADEALQIAELFGVSCDQVLGREPIDTKENIPINGLSELAVLSINKMAEKSPEKLEMLNAVLGHSRIINLLLDTLDLYVYSKIPCLINTGTEVKPNLLSFVGNEQTMIEAVVLEDIKNILQAVSNVCANKVHDKDEKDAILLFEQLKKSREKLDEQITEYNLNQAQDILDFEAEAQEQE